MKGAMGKKEFLAPLDYQDVQVKEEEMDHQEEGVGGFHANALNFLSTVLAYKYAIYTTKVYIQSVSFLFLSLSVHLFISPSLT